MDASKLLTTTAPPSTLLVRIAVGWVFIIAGSLKFLDPGEYGTGRFEGLGFPMPEVIGPLVGGFEVICGLLVLVGLATRLAAVPLMVIMVVAIITTKIPTLAEDGFWQFGNDVRLDLSMLLAATFLAVVGAGRYSVDAQLTGRRTAP